MPFPFLFGVFFFSAWLAMIFWGMIAPDVGLLTIGYPKAMLATIGLWLVVFPLARMGFGRMAPFAAMGGMGRRGRGWSHGEGGGPAPSAAGGWQASDQDVINIASSFSGSSRRVTSKSFQGGNVSANFGGVQLDMREAALAASGATLNVRAFIGGIDIVVPQGWDVVFDVSAFLGGIADQRVHPGYHHTNGAPRLVVTGSATLGGVNIKDA